jgi:hypothetical protein
MILISHRGNIFGPGNQLVENSTNYIDNALANGYDVEIDVWLSNGDLFLGHDFPIHTVSLPWLFERKDSLWIHCKNFNALSSLIQMDLRVFYHIQEDYSIISNGMIWAHNLSDIDSKCIIPLLDRKSIDDDYSEAFGVCSDYVGYMNND